MLLDHEDSNAADAIDGTTGETRNIPTRSRKAKITDDVLPKSRPFSERTAFAQAASWGWLPLALVNVLVTGAVVLMRS